MMKQNAILWPWFLAVVLASSGMATGRPPRRWTYQEPRLGTQVRLVLFAEEEPAATAAAAFSEIDRLNGIFSDYDENSELMRLCKAPAGTPRPVSAELTEVLIYSQQLAAETAGAFDITVGPFSQLWRRARRQKQLPSAAAIAEARTQVGFQLLKMDADQMVATLARSGMQLDLGGIAKGAIADLVFRNVLKPNTPAAMIALGGDVRLGEPPPGEAGWKVDVVSTGGSPTETLLLARCAISTSGDLEQYFEKDGKRYSHIIDPRTGWGVEGCRLATVVAPTGMEADALATALCVLSMKEGERLITGKAGVAARWVNPNRTGKPQINSSPAWTSLLRAKN